MTEEHSETTGLKVVTVGRDGKRRYDRQTKQKLVEACLEPSASVAGLALKHGVNANLLRKWIKLHQQRLAGTSLAPIGTSFVPVVEVDSHEAVVVPESAKAQRHTPAARTLSPALASARLTVQMPNGVTLRFECSGNDASLLSAMIETLERCDVPPGR
ncbi:MULTISPECIES: IS66-like element accessory protein TnpA [Burkholderiaceae]|uniref:IS66-like element accessory protein TnpA n=1 Tax=Burkholderiaceae TaxID=119060 RepID=UPI00076B3517|nr:MULTISPECIES: transposase [Burkholderiaceae]AME27169.1 transposase [Burkholderia sp. PAMC 26561]AME27682.1 transposase [Burkholderia sp. PAMC 26561]